MTFELASRRPRGALSLLALAALVSACSNFGADGPGGPGSGGGLSGGGGSGANDGVGGSFGDGGASGSTIETVEGDAGQTVQGTATATTSTGEGAGAFDSTGSSGQGPAECEVLTENYDLVASVVVDDSNSFASPLLVRELIGDSTWDASRALPVRPHEFLNLFAEPIGDAALSYDGELSIRVDALRAAFQESETSVLLELGVTVTPGTVEAPIPDITFLFDTSSTMVGEPSGRAMGVLRGAARRLGADQQVAVLSWATEGRLLQTMVPSGQIVVDDVVAAIEAQGTETDFDAALMEALSISRDQAEASGNPGVVLVITDGKTAADPATLERVSEERDQLTPVRVVGVGVGPARGYSDEVLDELTDRSGGAYFYVPDQASAADEVEARFDVLTRVAARSVGLELHLPSSVGLVAITGEQGEAGSGNPVDGQNLAVGSTMAFHLLLRVTAPDACQALGIGLRWTDLDGNTSRFPEIAGNSEPVDLDALLTGEPSAEMRRISAVAQVTAALQGPTSARINAACSTLISVLEGAADPMVELATMLARRCEATDDGACQPCTPPAL